MPAYLQQHLQQVKQSPVGITLKSLQCGIEKEGLRVDLSGRVSHKDHPLSLGSSLTHGSITTDYSEALLEYITPVFQSPTAALVCPVTLPARMTSVSQTLGAPTQVS